MCFESCGLRQEAPYDHINVDLVIHPRSPNQDVVCYVIKVGFPLVGSKIPQILSDL